MQTCSISVTMSLRQKTDGRHSTRSLIDISSIRSSDSRCWASEMPLRSYQLASSSMDTLEILETISLKAYWNRRIQNSAFRPHGELLRPSDEENMATERTSVVLWDTNFSDLLHISSYIGKQLHKSGNKWQCVLYGRFHIRLMPLRHVAQKVDELRPDNCFRCWIV